LHFSTGLGFFDSGALPPKIIVHPPRCLASTTVRWWRKTPCHQQLWW